MAKKITKNISVSSEIYEINFKRGRIYCLQLKTETHTWRWAMLTSLLEKKILFYWSIDGVEIHFLWLWIGFRRRWKKKETKA